MRMEKNTNIQFCKFDIEERPLTHRRAEPPHINQWENSSVEKSIMGHSNVWQYIVLLNNLLFALTPKWVMRSIVQTTGNLNESKEKNVE